MEKDRVLELAEVSKIAMTDAEAKGYAAELESVLGMIEKIKEFDKNVLFTDDNALKFEELREDVAVKKDKMAESISQEKNGGFTVPKVV